MRWANPAGRTISRAFGSPDFERQSARCGVFQNERVAATSWRLTSRLDTHAHLFALACSFTKWLLNYVGETFAQHFFSACVTRALMVSHIILRGGLLAAFLFILALTSLAQCTLDRTPSVRGLSLGMSLANYLNCFPAPPAEDWIPSIRRSDKNLFPLTKGSAGMRRCLN
jgi:hypothetical protein